MSGAAVAGIAALRSMASRAEIIATTRKSQTLPPPASAILPRTSVEANFRMAGDLRVARWPGQTCGGREGPVPLTSRVSVVAYIPGNLFRRLVLPRKIENRLLTSLQQRLAKTGVGW